MVNTIKEEVQGVFIRGQRGLAWPERPERYEEEIKWANIPGRGKRAGTTALRPETVCWVLMEGQRAWNEGALRVENLLGR